MRLKKNIIYLCNTEKGASGGAKIIYHHSELINNLNNFSSQVIHIKKKKTESKIYIRIASFYSEDSAIYLKKRILSKISNYDKNKLKIVRKSNKKINLFSGPYNSISLVKNEYTKLAEFGFEDLDITINEQ